MGNLSHSEIYTVPLIAIVLFSQEEAAMHIRSMHLMQKSRQVNFIDTTPKETCIVIPKGNIAQLNPDDEDIFATQIHDRYASHPVELENMTLAHFATKFAVIYSGKSNDTEHGQTEPNE